MKFIKEFQGNSGCKLKLFRDRRNLFVRKFSSNIQYNKRLKLQMQKQKDFRHHLVKTPKIYKFIHMSNDVAFFDMEYINARTLSLKIVEYDIYEITEYLTIVTEFIKTNLENSTYNIKTKEKVLNKALSLTNEFKNNDIKNLYTSYINNIRWEKLPIGDCHGDLTLENILVDNNDQYYFIDFLDSFIESPILDISKLYQEVFLHWSFRNTTISENILIKYAHIKKELDKFIKKVLDENTQQILNGINVITFARLLPYTSNQKQTENIYKLIKSILKE